MERPDTTGKNFPFVINVGTGDSMLTPAEPATLESWFSPVAFDVLDAEAAKQPARNTAEMTLWPWLVGLAGIVLICGRFLRTGCARQRIRRLASVVVHRAGCWAGPETR